jgi:hypothetical protein
VRWVEDITEALWGTRVSPSTVSDLNKKIYATIEAWRNRPIEGEHPYVYLDGIVLKRSRAGEVRNVSLLVAIAVNSEGYREILGICGGAKEDKAGWSAFLKHLKERGVAGVRLIISDLPAWGFPRVLGVLSRSSLAAVHRGIVEEVVLSSSLSAGLPRRDLEATHCRNAHADPDESGTPGPFRLRVRAQWHRCLVLRPKPSSPTTSNSRSPAPWPRVD